MQITNILLFHFFPFPINELYLAPSVKILCWFSRFVCAAAKMNFHALSLTYCLVRYTAHVVCGLKQGESREGKKEKKGERERKKKEKKKAIEIIMIIYRFCTTLKHLCAPNYLLAYNTERVPIGYGGTAVHCWCNLIQNIFKHVLDKALRFKLSVFYGVFHISRATVCSKSSDPSLWVRAALTLCFIKSTFAFSSKRVLSANRYNFAGDGL